LLAPIRDGLSLDPFTLFEDGGRPAEMGLGRPHVFQALVVALVVAVLDEYLDLSLEVAGQEVVFLQDAVLQGLVPALDLALSRGCIGAPSTWLIFRASTYSASSPAMQLGPLSLSSQGLCSTLALSQPEAAGVIRASRSSRSLHWQREGWSPHCATRHTCFMAIFRLPNAG